MQREGGEVVLRTNLLATLARREVTQKGQDLAQESGGTFHMAKAGERITGQYKGAVALVSGTVCEGRRFWTCVEVSF
jgi:hypothetical protein